MTRSKGRQAGTAGQGGVRSRAGATYDVGYGKPPKQHQFQPGQSGNRGGRPKGAKNTATLLRDILDRKIAVQTGGTVRKISVREAMLTRFAEAALKGDIKSAAFLLERYDRNEQGGQDASGAANPDEQEIIDSYVAQYVKKGDDK
jgi:hypothetical protein